MLPHARPLSGPARHANGRAFSRSVPGIADRSARCPVAIRARRSSAAADADDAEASAPRRRSRRPQTTADAAADEQLPPAAPTAAAAGTDSSDAGKRKRGRKTKAELQQVQQQVDQQLQQGGDLEWGGDFDEEQQAMQTGLLVPAEGPGSWADAAATGAGEEDRRRFSYHRRLHNAAKDGNTAAAEATFAAMGAAGLPPGPRAYHVLLCCYLKAGDLPGALAVTARATDAGVQLLPESYAALIYSHMELRPPDVAVAKALYGALPGTGGALQAPWAVLCRLLAAKGFAADAVAAVLEGLAAGLLLDEDVGEAYITALCDTQQADAALKVLETARTRHGFTPEARHVNYVVAAYALAGNFTDAAGLIDAAGSRGWGRDAGSFNALLAGLVQELRRLARDEREPPDTLVTDFSMTRPRMLQSGVRPDKITFKLEAEGHVVLRDARSAMAAVKSMRNMAGAMGCRLLEPAALSGLLLLLCEQDMPVDLLQLLVYMSEDSCRLPPGSLAADSQGRSLLSRWVVGHLEGMATRTEARAASEGMAGTEAQSINGVAIGRGQCVVDDDGLIVPVSKCSMKELRAEAEARGMAGAVDMKRPELTAAIKAARARLPFNVLQAQVTGTRTPAGRKTAAKPAAAGKRKGARAFYREQWTIDERFNLEREQAAREVLGAEQFLLEGQALDALDVTDDQYGVASLKAMMGVNFEAVMEARMLDEGTAAILNVGDEDVTTGFATLLPGVGDEEEDEEDDEAPGSTEGGELDDKAWRAMEREAEAMALGNGTESLQEGYSQLVMMEAQQIDTDEANLIAGMDIAMDVVRAAEICGGASTAADVLTLAAGAQAERSPAAAAAVAARMSVLLQSSAVDSSTGQQYSREFVLQQYEQLADMCLRFRAPVYADAVLEAAEKQGLRPSPEMMQRLMLAMRGKPRRSERISRESAALLDRAGIETTAEEDEEQMRMQQQEQQLAAADVTDVAALSAVERPLLGAAGSSQQQEQQDEAEEDAEEVELSEDMAEIADLLKGVTDANAFRERVHEALTTGGGGLSAEDAADVMDQPETLLVELASWLPQELMDTDEDSDDEEDDADDAAAAAAAGGEQQQQEGEEQMTLLQLAHACANDSLTAEQQELLLARAEAHGLPLMLDEERGKLVWPGTPEYEAWAAEEPEEEQADLQAMYDAFQEVFAEQLAQAERGADALVQQTVNEDGTWKDVEPEQQQQLDAMQRAFLENLKNSGMFDVREADQGEGEVEGVTVSSKQGAAMDIDQQLAALAEQFGPSIEAKRAELDLQLLQESGIDVAALRLDQPRAGSGSARNLAASSSSSDQQ